MRPFTSHLTALSPGNMSQIYSWYDQSKADTASAKDTDAKTAVRQFYAFVINGNNLRYKTIVSSTISISVVFAGIYLSDSIATSTWTETIKNSTTNTVDAVDALDNFEAWEQATSGLPGHDHAMLFTKYDVTHGGSSSIAGRASTGGVCGATRQSIAEDSFTFQMMVVAAHELGHNLGSAHDGTGNMCLSSDGWIMSSTSSVQTGSKATNPWHFSSCSVTDFETKITALNNEGSNCLSSLSATFDPTALTSYDQVIPGQLYDPDEQCRHIEGAASFLCRRFYYQDYTRICTEMFCDLAGLNRCSYNFAAEGTTCGNNKWCVGGQCVTNSSAPSVSDKCPFGDRAGVISHGSTCANAIGLSVYNCNHGWHSTCCASCGAAYTGIADCLYGDKASGCVAASCPTYGAATLANCCGTCAVTTTTQTQTTTTTTIPPTTTTTTIPPTTTTTTIPPTTTTTIPPTTTTTIPPTTTTTIPPTTTTTIPPTTTTTIPPTTTTTVAATTAALPANRIDFAVVLTLDYAIAVEVDLTNHNDPEYIVLQAHIIDALTYLFRNVPGFLGVIVISIRSGSAIVDHTVITTDTDTAKSGVSNVLTNLASGQTSVYVNGTSVQATGVTLSLPGGTPVIISSTTDKCTTMEIIGGCSTDYICTIINGDAACRPDTKDRFSLFEEYGVGISVFFLAMVAICVVIYCRRFREKPDKLDFDMRKEDHGFRGHGVIHTMSSLERGDTPIPCVYDNGAMSDLPGDNYVDPREHYKMKRPTTAF